MMNENYTIRAPETQAEWDIIPALLRDYHREFNDDTCFTSFDAEMADISGVYSSPGSHLIIAVENKTMQIAGCVAMRSLSPDIAEMKRLYVVPSHRGIQLGKKLAVGIINYATENNYSRMLLDTMHTMSAAQELYRLLGFHLIGAYNDQDLLKVACFEKMLS
ncbi:MAG: GNAT family N-acetyltransferase [Saprospiraceae bacterium]